MFLRSQYSALKISFVKFSFYTNYKNSVSSLLIQQQTPTQGSFTNIAIAVVTWKFINGKANKCTCHAALPFPGLGEVLHRNHFTLELCSQCTPCICRLFVSRKTTSRLLFLKVSGCKLLKRNGCIQLIHIFQRTSTFLSYVPWRACSEVRKCNLLYDTSSLQLCSGILRQNRTIQLAREWG